MKKTVLVLFAAVSLIMTACAGDNNDTASSIKMPEIGGEIVSGADGSGELRSLTPVSDSAAKEALVAVTGSNTIAEASPIADGVSLYSYNLGEGKAYVVKADLTKVNLTASTPYHIKPNGVNQPLASQVLIAEDTVFACISANAFNASTKEPVGIIVTDGKQIYDKGFNDGSVCFGTTDGGKAFACAYGDYAKLHRNKTAEVVSGTRFTVNNGKVLEATSTENDARSAAGFTADRNTLYIVFAENADCESVAKLLLGHGCAVAVEFGYEGLGAAMYTPDVSYGTSDGIGAALFITQKEQKEGK